MMNRFQKASYQMALSLPDCAATRGIKSRVSERIEREFELLRQEKQRLKWDFTMLHRELQAQLADERLTEERREQLVRADREALEILEELEGEDQSDESLN